MPAKTRSIQDLKEELRSSVKQLRKLRTRRRALLADLKALDLRIASISGQAATRKRKKKATKAKRRKTTRPKATKKKTKHIAKRTAKRATGKPLAEYISAVLKKASEGIRAKDIAQAVTKAGYLSHSKDFYTIVATALRDTTKFKRLSRGIYTRAG